MRIIFFLTLLLLASCRKEEAGFNKLTDAEKDYLRELGRLQCMEETSGDFASFVDQSDDQFNGSASNRFYRNKNWLAQVKSGTTVLRTSKINVWKVATNTVYFILTNTTAESPTPTYQFIKVTSDTNNEMITDLNDKACRVLVGREIGQSSSSLTYNLSTSTDIEGDLRTKTVKTNTFKYGELAFFGNYAYAQTVDTVKRDDSPTVPATATVKTDGTLVLQTDIEPIYTNYVTYGAQYCVVSFTAGTPNSYNFPYELTCSAVATPAFDPAAELPL